MKVNNQIKESKITIEAKVGCGNKIIFYAGIVNIPIDR